METSLFAFLRGINVSSKNIILMNDLKKLFESMGFTDASTYIQSGNVIFKNKSTNTPEITSIIKKNIKIKFGFNVEVIVKTLNELKNIIDNNPFDTNGLKEKERIYITLLSGNPSKEKTAKQKIFSNSIDDYEIINSEVYILCRGGYGKTQFSNTFFEKTLGVPATTRNWETMNKIYNLGIITK